MSKHRIIPTCETAVSALPEWHRAAFEAAQDRVTSPEGWSPGALNLAQGVAIKVQEQLIHNIFTRLLIDLSCAPDDPKRWSDVSQTLTDEQRDKLDTREQGKFLETLETRVAAALRQQERPVHISFNTRLEMGQTAAIIHHDPNDTREAAFSTMLATKLRALVPNGGIEVVPAPPSGQAEWLKQRQPEALSLRIIAAQEAFLAGKPVAWAALKKAIITALAEARETSPA